MQFAGLVTVEATDITSLEGWYEGPLPLELPFGGVTDRAARSDYFDRRTSRTLYGEAPDSTRLYRVVDVPLRMDLVPRLRVRDSRTGLRCEGVELLRVRAHEEAAVALTLHLAGEVEDAGAFLSVWSDLLRWKSGGDAGAKLSAILVAALGIPVKLRSRSRPTFSISFLDALPGEPPPFGPAAGVAVVDQWLFAMAAAVTPSQFTPHPTQWVSLMEHRHTLSDDWSALVLRDGAAFVGHHEQPSNFLRSTAPVYVRSIYGDALQLGTLQRSALAELTDRLAALDDPARNSRLVERLDTEFSRVRNTLWWQDVTQHGIANDLLASFQQQHNLQTLMEQTKSELEDYSRQANLRSGRILNAIVSLFAVVGIIAVLVDVYALYRPGQTPSLEVSLGTAITVVVVTTLVGLYALGLLRRR